MIIEYVQYEISSGSRIRVILVQERVTMKFYWPWRRIPAILTIVSVPWNVWLCRARSHRHVLSPVETRELIQNHLYSFNSLGLPTRVENGRLSSVCKSRDGEERSKSSTGRWSAGGRSGRARNCSKIWLVVGRCDGSWLQQASMRFHIWSFKPRTCDKSWDGRGGLLPDWTANMIWKSFLISLNGQLPENIFFKTISDIFPKY